MSNLEKAVAKIDAANARDPRRVEIKGQFYPFEQLHAQKMTEWISKLAPKASEALLLAGRGQHICRWTIPRQNYPQGLTGYLTWRENLKQFHAEKVAEILKSVGYDEELIQRVRSLIHKENFPDDPESQTLEDALCLSFLELQFAGFAKGHSEDKVVDIVQKTWQKMSPKARDFALALSLPPAAGALVAKALRAATS